MILTMRRGWLWWMQERDVYFHNMHDLRRFMHKGWRIK